MVLTGKRISRWYFGGIASCGAACCTHPLDLIKVHLHTQQEVKLRMTGMALQVLRSDGALALYNGPSASTCRQLTYSMTRFAIYETVRDMMTDKKQEPMSFYQKRLLSAFGVWCVCGHVQLVLAVWEQARCWLGVFVWDYSQRSRDNDVGEKNPPATLLHLINIDQLDSSAVPLRYGPIRLHSMLLHYSGGKHKEMQLRSWGTQAKCWLSVHLRESLSRRVCPPEGVPVPACLST
ncbi:mitochondrial dicarboxylate carrier [Electrophorus electricus]|uniref:mitochondrial dicarboxylate carrier n=1 Tax=Electrophorus electricus TaxID=8005 RepID=UPI0015CFE8D4|nr:mitochondrial dicarboxylate carrier [Electrophorus electricus]